MSVVAPPRFTCSLVGQREKNFMKRESALTMHEIIRSAWLSVLRCRESLFLQSLAFPKVERTLELKRRLTASRCPIAPCSTGYKRNGGISEPLKIGLVLAFVTFWNSGGRMIMIDCIIDCAVEHTGILRARSQCEADYLGTRVSSTFNSVHNIAKVNGFINYRKYATWLKSLIIPAQPESFHSFPQVGFPPMGKRNRVECKW